MQLLLGSGTIRLTTLLLRHHEILRKPELRLTNVVPAVRHDPADHNLRARRHAFVAAGLGEKQGAAARSRMAKVATQLPRQTYQPWCQAAVSSGAKQCMSREQLAGSLREAVGEKVVCNLAEAGP